MRTTFSMILDRLAAQNGAAPVGVKTECSIPVCAVARYEVGAWREDVLYIAERFPVEGDCPRQMIVLQDVGKGPNVGNYAAFAQYESCELLLAAAQAALSFYSRWGDHVLELIYSNRGLDEIVDFAYEIFQNPILIYDSSLKVLAFTKNDGSTDRMWRDTVQKGSVSDMSAEEAHEFLRYVNKLDNSAKPFKHIGKGLSDPFYNGNILLNGKRVGMVDLMERNHPITRGETDLLEAFCYLLSFELQKDAIRRENKGNLYHQLIVDLLEGDIKDASSLHARLAAARWRPQPYMRVVCFQPENDFMADPELRRAFDHLLALSVGRAILLDRRITLLLGCFGDQWTEEMQQILLGFCSAHQLRCGVSDAYRNLLDTSRFAGQPLLALSLSEERIVSFDSVRFLNLLNHCKTQLHDRELLHPVIVQLAAHDAQHDTQYLDTMEALLDNQYNQILAARVLHIHRTTLIYRLQRITKLTGVKLDDAGELLHIHFSLKVYRSMQKEEPAGQER